MTATILFSLALGAFGCAASSESADGTGPADSTGATAEQPVTSRDAFVFSGVQELTNAHLVFNMTYVATNTVQCNSPLMPAYGAKQTVRRELPQVTNGRYQVVIPIGLGDACASKLTPIRALRS